MSTFYRAKNAKPLWVIRAENDDARREAVERDNRDRSLPSIRIEQTVKRSPEYATAMSAFETEIRAFYAAAPTDAAEFVAYMRAAGGRTVVRNEIVARVGNVAASGFAVGFTALVSSYMGILDLQAIERRVEIELRP